MKTRTHYTVASIVLLIIAAVMAIDGNAAPPWPIKHDEAEPKATVQDVMSEHTIPKGYVGVVRIVDGDTFIALIDGKEEKIRLIGIDTPEIVDPRKPVQCFGREASGKAKELLDGKIVRLEDDKTQENEDKYGRLLRYVYLEDGTLVNEHLIKEGYAHEYTYKIPYRQQTRFKDAERYARENKKGLWADGACANTGTR